MTKDKIIELIDNRIKSEYRKHKDLDWSQIAAHKIYGSLVDLFTTPFIANSFHVDELIKSLGEPVSDNEYKIRPDADGKWWIEHKIVGSGEPLKQFLTGKPVGCDP